MAVHFGNIDGNHNVCLAGYFNAMQGGGYTSPIFGSTALSVCFTLQPDALLPLFGYLCQIDNGSLAAFKIYSNGSGSLSAMVFDNDLNYRLFNSSGATLVAGVPNRLTLRWRAVPESLQLVNNGVVVPGGLAGTPVAAIIAGPLPVSAPLELGSASGRDGVPVPGIYQQWAIWANHYLSDADVAVYGTTGDPAQMTVASSTTYWVTLAQASITPIDYATHSGFYAVGHVPDARTGVDYAATTATYDYGGDPGVWPVNGVFGVGTGAGSFDAAVVADLSTVAAPSVLVPDGPALPVEWFEMEELNGHCGQRTGLSLRIPQDYATFSAAMFAAQPGDDIVIDRVWSRTHDITVTDRDLDTKTADATTPRMPPHQKRRLTMSRARTSGR